MSESCTKSEGVINIKLDDAEVVKSLNQIEDKVNCIISKLEKCEDIAKRVEKLI